MGIPIAIMVIIFLPNPRSRYKAELVGQEIVSKPNCEVYFSDLDGEGVDETIEVFHNIFKGQAAVKVRLNNGNNYGQWNFNGKYHIKSDNHYIADLNNNGIEEIYLFYYRNDSVFLSAIEPFISKNLLIDERFITRIHKRDGAIDYTVRCINSVDADNDGFKEMIFAIVAGFSRQPRQLIKYDLQDDTLIRSVSVGISYAGMEILDINNDSLPEFFIGSSTTDNIPESMDIPFKDNNSWVVGFNSDLEFIIGPIENNGYPTSTAIGSIIGQDGRKILVAYYNTISLNNDKLVLYDHHFDVIDTITINIEFEDPSLKRLIMEQFIYLGHHGILVGKFDKSILFVDENGNDYYFEDDTDITGLRMKEDINKDGKDEYIFHTQIAENIIIFDSQLKYPVEVGSKAILYSDLPFLTGVKNNPNERLFYILAENHLYYYRYGIDLGYYLKYLVWLIVYLLVVLILWSSQKLQRIQTAKKQRIEETINSLQMKTIKSQMDPHFMFNVLNGLAHNVAKGNNEQAHDQILRFSQLLRSLMQRVERIDISLSEEIDFVRSYLELEKFRFKDDFEFIIKVDETIDLTQRIPRMLIQLLVENSIKHGLRNKKGIKKLNLDAGITGDRTSIAIEDNGIGRKAAYRYNRDSGKGLKLINDMIQLNRKMGGKNISIEYKDLHNESGVPTGTVVLVLV